MYSYRPHRSERHKFGWGLTRLPLSPVWMIGLLLGLFVGGLLIRQIAHEVYAEQLRAIPSPEIDVLPLYQERVAKEVNAPRLAKAGDRLVKKKLYRYAAVAFERATILDPNYRDAAYGWAYALVLANKGTLTPDELKNIHLAMAAAETVDPLYRPLLDLKLAIANLEHDQATAALTQKRVNLLENK